MKGAAFFWLGWGDFLFFFSMQRRLEIILIEYYPELQEASLKEINDNVKSNVASGGGQLSLSASLEYPDDAILSCNHNATSSLI